MKRLSHLKLIDLLSLKPGSLLHVHSIKGEAVCQQTENLVHSDGWQQEVCNAIFPKEDFKKRHNLSKLLEIPIETQVILRHPEENVVEMIRLDPANWEQLLSRVGFQAEIMVDGRVIARGEIVNSAHESGIRISEIAEKH